MTRARIIVLVLCTIGLLVCAFVPSQRGSLPNSGGQQSTATTKTHREEPSLDPPFLKARKDPKRAKKIEVFLKERGRTALNLFAADRESPDRFIHAISSPYMQELASMRDDATAMLISGFIDHNNDSLRRLRELAPDDAFARYVCAGEAEDNRDILQKAVEELRIACTRPNYHSLWPELERAIFEINTYLDGEAQGWASVAQFQTAIAEVSGTDSGMDLWFQHRDWMNDTPYAEALFSAAWDFAKLAEQHGDTVMAVRMQKLLDDAPQEIIQRLSGMDCESFGNHYYDQWRERRKLAESHREALTVATTEDFAMMEAILREKGLHAAQQALLDRIGPAEMQRIHKELNKNDPFFVEE